MSRPIPEEEYNRKTLTKVIQWAKGEKDPYLGNVESHAQRKFVPNERLIRKHRRDRENVIGMVLDERRNRVIKRFRVFYKVVSVVCCVALIAMLVSAVSYLPPMGSAENPASNEVVEKYIEDGMQDTGAVNIVTGMILDYRLRYLWRIQCAVYCHLYGADPAAQ